MMIAVRDRSMPCITIEKGKCAIVTTFIDFDAALTCQEERNQNAFAGGSDFASMRIT